MNDPQSEGHMASYIARRKFLATLGTAAAWPLAARPQQPSRKFFHIGHLQIARNENAEALILGLREAGYVNGQNARIESRYYGEIASPLWSVRLSISARAPNFIPSTIPRM